MGRANKHRVNEAKLFGCYQRRLLRINLERPRWEAELTADIAHLEQQVRDDGGNPELLLASVVERVNQRAQTPEPTTSLSLADQMAELHHRSGK